MCPMQETFSEGTLFITMFFGDKIPEYFYDKAKEFILNFETKLIELGAIKESNIESNFNIPIEE